VAALACARAALRPAELHSGKARTTLEKSVWGDEQ